MLSKAHLTSHSRMSALGKWSHHHGYLGREDLFLYSSSVYSCHPFLISSASVRSIPFLCYCAHLFMKYSLGISNFPEEISSLSHSIFFPLYFFALISKEDFLFSSCYSLELSIWIGISFFFSFAFSFSSFQLFISPPQKTILLFWISFSWGWSWSLPPAQCQESPS